MWILVEEKRNSLDKQVGSLKKNDVREVIQRREEFSSTQMANENGKERMDPMFKLRSGIEQTIDLKCVMEERILDNLVEFTLREILGIA